MGKAPTGKRKRLPLLPVFAAADEQADEHAERAHLRRMRRLTRATAPVEIPDYVHFRAGSTS